MKLFKKKPKPAYVRPEQRSKEWPLWALIIKGNLLVIVWLMVAVFIVKLIGG